jgi:hypothetical protein
LGDQALNHTCGDSMNTPTSVAWPELTYADWVATKETLHLWTQVVGKIRLSLTPWLNHGWQVPLYICARGLTTSPIPSGSAVFEISFDFIDQMLDIVVSNGSERRLPLQSQSVAEFSRRVMRALDELAITARITDQPCEIANAVAFSRDHEPRTYDASAAHRFWQALVQIDRVFKQFRTGFIGKSSPVHFFWGSFDLAVTRFSGRRAPRFEGQVPGVAIEVMREAYSHEVSSAGFWPGGNGVEEAMFYSYAYPASEGFRHSTVRPSEAFFSDKLGEFLLPYAAVCRASDPDALLMKFLESTYEAAANTAQWDRAALECSPGRPGVPRET